MGRPPIDLQSKVREILLHLIELPEEADHPLAHYNRSVTEAWNLRDYVERKFKKGGYYQAVAERHLGALDRMLLVNMIEAFERFLKETAAVCVDHLAMCVLDDRFDAFPLKGSLLAAHFDAKSLGKSLCESATWLDCDSVNTRFRHLLADPFDPHKGDFYVFPFKPGQQPESQSFRHPAMTLLWQLRHTLVHNVGIITQSDAVKFQLLARTRVDAPRLLKPSRDDVRYVKRFLDETAENVNERIALRLTTLLTTIHERGSTVFAPQQKANLLAAQFGIAMTVAGATGQPPAV